MPKLSLSKEFVDSSKTIDEGHNLDVVDSSEVDLDLSLNKQSNVIRIGRVSNFPSRYTDNCYTSFMWIRANKNRKGLIGYRILLVTFSIRITS